MHKAQAFLSTKVGLQHEVAGQFGAFFGCLNSRSRHMPPEIATTVVSIFADQPAAQSALDHLIREGVPRARIRLHESTPTNRNAVKLEVDEFVSGGFISNMSALLDGLFSQPVHQEDAATYATLVHSEGTLVSLQAQGPEEAERYEGLLRQSGALRVSILPEKDTVSFHRLYGP